MMTTDGGADFIFRDDASQLLGLKHAREPDKKQIYCSPIPMAD
jgi:hypothetical protein